MIGLMVIIGSVIFQGCNKEEYDSYGKDEIINSIEFEDYIKANIKMTSLFQKVYSMTKDSKIKDNVRTGVTPEGATFKTFPFKINQRLLIEVSEKRSKFLQKYSYFTGYDYETKKELVEKVMSDSKPINELLMKSGLDVIGKQLLRLKSGSVEGNGVYTYDDYMNALMDAMCYSYENQLECSGYVFADGTAVMYINKNASHSSTSYPGPVVNYCIDGADVSVYNGNVIESTYHTHFNSERFSDTDNNTQSNYYPNSTLIILYNDNIYEYNYEYGYFLP